MQPNPWLSAIRPKTLSLAMVPVLVGSVLAWTEGTALRWSVAIAALLAATLIQIGTNLHNDAADFERGADDPATRLGPPRATAEGWLSAREVRRGAALSFTGAFLLGIYLVWVGGWFILVLGLASIAAGLAYTAGPRPIAYSGLGELFVLLFFGVAGVAGSHYLQTGHLSEAAVLAGLAIGLPASAVLAVNNYRDLDNDRAVGKITLAVRLGRPGSRLEYALLMLGPFPLLGLWSSWLNAGLWPLLPLLALPWALALIRRLYVEPPGRGLNRLLAATARFQLGLGSLLCLALLTERILPLHGL
jgi:1,4-dihydroxy-2-naphthoate octaprenyltransferase